MAKHVGAGQCTVCGRDGAGQGRGKARQRAKYVVEGAGQGTGHGQWQGQGVTGQDRGSGLAENCGTIERVMH